MNDRIVGEQINAYAKPELKEIAIVQLISTTPCPMVDPSPCSSFDS